MKRNITRLGVSLTIGLGLLLASLLLLGLMSLRSPVAQAADFTVCAVGCVFTNIQAAVDAASDGDVVKVAAGTYTGVHPRPDPYGSTIVTQVVYISKSITLQGGYTFTNWVTPDPEANPTTIDAQGQGRVIFIGGTYETMPPPWISPIISGFRITGGNVQGIGAEWFHTHGAGIFALWAEVTIYNNTIFSNTASGRGGGISLVACNGSVTNNILHSNQADGGGGLFLEGWTPGETLSETSLYTVSHNTIVTNTAYGGGGGAHLLSQYGYSQ
ncbi:MAG: right-handed parallel beta-helix repeat-containing protein [Anaerolineae bacterium]|nr:right-handed parallel beta-helix repeat-containing protein [Anaerolineae bacterium]